MPAEEVDVVKLGTHVLAGLVLAGGMTVACGGGPGPAHTATPAQSPTASATAAPTKTPTVAVTPTSAPTATATVTGLVSLYPVGTRTGVTVIDEFVASLEQSDAARLATLLRYSTVYCTAAPDDIFPPCAAASPERSPVQAVFWGRCDAGWVPRDVDRSADLARFVKGGQRLYAAISLPAPGSWITDYGRPTGRYFVVMDVPGDPSGEPRGAILNESGVVALLTGCYFQSPEGFLTSHLQGYAGQSAVPTFLLPPPE